MKNTETIKTEIATLIGSDIKLAYDALPSLYESIRTIDDLGLAKGIILKLYKEDNKGKPKDELMRLFDTALLDITSGKYADARATLRSASGYRKHVEIALKSAIGALLDHLDPVNKEPKEEEPVSEEEAKVEEVEENSKPVQNVESVKVEEVDDVDIYFADDEDEKKSKKKKRDIEFYKNEKNDMNIIGEIMENVETEFFSYTDDIIKLKTFVRDNKYKIINELKEQLLTIENVNDLYTVIYWELAFDYLNDLDFDIIKRRLKELFKLYIIQDDTNNDPLKQYFNKISEDLQLKSIEDIDDYFKTLTKLKDLRNIITDIHKSVMKDELIKAAHNTKIEPSDIQLMEDINSILYGVSAVEYLSKLIYDGKLKQVEDILSEILESMQSVDVRLNKNTEIEFTTSMITLLDWEDFDTLKISIIRSLKDQTINKSDSDVIKYYNEQLGDEPSLAKTSSSKLFDEIGSTISGISGSVKGIFKK